MTETPNAKIEPFSKPIGRYSPILVRRISDETAVVTISGQVAIDSHGLIECKDDPKGQAEIVFERLIGLLSKAGGQLSDLQSVTIFIANRDFFPIVNEVRNRFFRDHAPASTLIVAQLVEPDCLVEVNGFAVIRDARKVDNV